MSLKKILFPVALIVIAFFFSCKKDDVSNNAPVLPDLVSKISASASGFVTDENNNAVVGASVRMGTSTVVTDQFGYFEFENVQVVKTAAVITVTHNGYFKGIRTFAATENSPAFVRIKLSPKTIIGTINGSAGGNVSTAQGLNVALPANGVVDKTTGAAYTGTVTVTAKWLDPTSNDISATMPGDLRALNEEGEMKLLITYGMVGVELTGDAGQQLQIASGKNATLSFPIPASMNAQAPSSIPLWHFDEEKGLWIEEGSAVKNGDKYVGEVSHFTFWNVDVPQNFVRIEGRIVADNGTHLSAVTLKISDLNNPANFRFGITNTQGFFDGFIPINSSLKLEVINSSNSCYSIATSQTFQTTNAALNLGNVVVSTANTGVAQISGTLVDCNNIPIPGTSIFCRTENSYQVFATDSSGNFNFNVLLCQAGTPAQFTILDPSGIPTPTQTFNLNPGVLSLDTITVCNSPLATFFSYAINGVPESFTEPTFDLIQSVAGNEMRVQIIGPIMEGIVVFDQLGIGQNTGQHLYSFSPVNGAPLTPLPGDSVIVRITEFGMVGEYIAGHFSGAMGSATTPVGIIYNVQGSFRVRRNQ